MKNVIKIKYYPWRIEIDLHELFYYNDRLDKDEHDADVIHYSKLQRVTKLFRFFHQVRFDNEESIEHCLNWLNAEKETWKQQLEIASDGVRCFRVGSSGHRHYKSEVSSCNRFLKLFDTAIRILHEGR